MMHDDRPGIDETYSSAITSSNLRVEAEKRGPADVLIASGMASGHVTEKMLISQQATRSVLKISMCRTGGALMRLRAEYGSDSVPRRNASATDHRLMMGRLKTLPAVLEAVSAQAYHWGIDRPQAVALAVVSHWLDNICRHCEGRGKEKIKDTPTLSGINCKHCKGTGRIDLTHGSAGRRMEGYISDCVTDWATRTKRLLREMR